MHRQNERMALKTTIPFNLTKLAGVLVFCVLCLLQTGCYYVASAECFHSEGIPEVCKGQPIELAAGDVRVTGKLTATNTIVFTFVPVVPAFVANSNPYHLRLWTSGADPNDVQVTLVALETHDGKTLFKAERPEDFLAHSSGKLGSGRAPIFSTNPEFKDTLRRRRSSRNGWPDSRPVVISSSTRELLLRIAFRRRDEDGTFGAPGNHQIKLKYYKHTGTPLLTDSIFFATGNL